MTRTMIMLPRDRETLLAWDREWEAATAEQRMRQVERVQSGMHTGTWGECYSAAIVALTMSYAKGHGTR